MASQVSPAEVRQLLEAKDANVTLLDVREDDEVAVASLSGAMHIPMNSISERLQELDPQQQIVVFCHHGMRSEVVADYLLENGFSQVKNMTGGIDAWALQVDASVARY